MNFSSTNKSRVLYLNQSEDDTLELRLLENNLDETDVFLENKKNLIRKTKLMAVDKTDQFKQVFKRYNYTPLFRRSIQILNQDLDRIINRHMLRYDEMQLKKHPRTPFVKLKINDIQLKSCIKSNQLKETKKGIVLGLGNPMTNKSMNKN